MSFFLYKNKIKKIKTFDKLKKRITNYIYFCTYRYRDIKVQVAELHTHSTKTHRNTELQILKGSETQSYRNTEVQKHRGTETKRYRNTELQKHRVTEKQRNRSTE